MKLLVCVALMFFASICTSRDASAQQGAATLTRQMTDTAAASLQRSDSLYRARDTTSLMEALRDWKGRYPPRVTLYRGLTALWTGRVPEALTILEQLPAVDSAFDSAIDSANVRSSRSFLEAPEPILEALTSPDATPPPEPEQIRSASSRCCSHSFSFRNCFSDTGFPEQSRVS
jgi:hypothetical protein